MKKNIIIGAALFIISLCNLLAQDVIVSASVSERFEKDFHGATDVKWHSLAKNITLVKFNYMGDFCLAYIDKDGAVITRGRKIKSIDDLPLQVNSTLIDVKNRNEKRYGAVSLGSIFEMVKNDATAYYVPMENNKISLLFSITAEGTADLQRKVIRNVEPQPAKNVLAKKD